MTNTAAATAIAIATFIKCCIQIFISLSFVQYAKTKTLSYQIIDNTKKKEKSPVSEKCHFARLSSYLVVL